MKKLMFVAAAAVCGVVFADGVESENIVGYINKDNAGKKYAPVGAMFYTVGETSWRLGDIKPADGSLDYKAEFLQEFNPTTGAIGQKYCYVDATAITANPIRRWADPSSAIGWWKFPTAFNNSGAGDSERADDVTFAAGSGLYSNFPNASAALEFSGAVINEELQIDLTGKKFCPIVNHLARTITLSEIVPETGSLDYKAEFLQEFNPTTGAIGQKYCYVDASAITANPIRRWADPSSAIGWWKFPTAFNNSGAGDSERADDVELAPGEGFYSNFPNASAVLNFPKSIAE